jgi:pimeloyl-ACP methyl ester carboxylesterase
MTTSTIHHDGADLHVEEHGSGAPLLLLHGTTGTGGDFRHVFDLDALAAERRWIAPDARAHGRSTNPDGVFTFRRCAEDLLAILDALGVATADAVGVSLGAKTLLHAATIAPERFGKMILVSAAPRFPDASRATMRAFAAMEHPPEEWQRMRALHVHGDAQIDALWKLPASFADHPTDMSFTKERLRAIRAKTLLVAGDRDPLYPVELAVELYRGIPDAALWVVPGGGHGPVFLDRREAFVGVALPFLRG